MFCPVYFQKPKKHHQSKNLGGFVWGGEEAEVSERECPVLIGAPGGLLPGGVPVHPRDVGALEGRVRGHCDAMLRGGNRVTGRALQRCTTEIIDRKFFIYSGAFAPSFSCERFWNSGNVRNGSEPNHKCYGTKFNSPPVQLPGRGESSLLKQRKSIKIFHSSNK